MFSRTSHRTCIAALLLISIQITSSVPTPAKTRPVIEVVNEHARIDDKPITQGFLPYSNPLAGNSKQNVKLHAQNQQAMFNAERVRQHRAQLQRWTSAPQQEDSYMKAYHESQENHQLALEKQQAKLRDSKAVTVAPKLRNAPSIKRAPKTQKLEVAKVTRADAVVKTERTRSRESKTGTRNHRSYGSIVSLSQYLQPKLLKQKTLYVSPGPTYDQGVTIKPNGNVGLASLNNAQTQEETKLYTAAIPSNTQYVYPKQYHQMQSYQSAYDIDTLNSLLNKDPNEQLTEFNALLNHESKDTLTTPIDLYFYLKDKPEYGQNYDHTKYAQIPNYANAYSHETKDHTPITEDVDDIDDPNKHRPKPYTVQSAASQPSQPQEDAYTVETTTTKSNNYYKLEVASQTISAPYNPKASYYYKPKVEKPTHQVAYYQPYHKDPKLESDQSERYLHHNAQHNGIQHLTEDGSGISAYGDDNVSISCQQSTTNICNKVRKPRSLETDPFLIPSKGQSFAMTTETPTGLTTAKIDNNSPKAAPLIRLNNYAHPKNELSTFLTTPNFPVGVANDYPGGDQYDDSFRPVRLRPRYRANRFKPVKYDLYDEQEEDDESYDDEEYEAEYDSRLNNRFNQNRLFNGASLYNNNRPFQNYAPSSTYSQNVDSTGSFSQNFNRFNGPNLNQNSFSGYGQNGHGINQDYGVPQYSAQNSYGVQDSYGPPESQNYGEPPVYGPPKPDYGPPKPSPAPIVPIRYGSPIHTPNNVIEPIYMLTQSQLKDLIGDHNLNIQHYDIYQLNKPKKKSRPHFPRKHKKRNQGPHYPKLRNFKKHLSRLHKYRG